AGPAALGPDGGPGLLAKLHQERPEDILFRVEVVVEGARRQVGLAHDVARGRLAEPLLGEHAPRGSEKLLSIVSLAFLAPPREGMGIHQLPPHAPRCSGSGGTAPAPGQLNVKTTLPS